MIGQAISARRRLAPAALLAAACMGLGGAIASEWADWHEKAPPTPPQAASAAAPPPAANFAMPALPTYGEVLSRPLFSTTRRPSEQSSAPAAAPNSMTLVAILISPRGPHALIRHGTPPQTERVVEGDTVDGWTAEAIKFDRVIFRRGADVLELVPISAEQPRQAPAPAVSAQPARPAPVSPRGG